MINIARVKVEREIDMAIKDDTEQKVQQGVEEKEQINISDFAFFKALEKEEKECDIQIKEIEEKIKALREFKAKNEIEKEQLKREIEQLPPVLASGLGHIWELEKQIKYLTDEIGREVEGWREEALKSGIKEEFVNIMLRNLGFAVSKEGGDRKRKSRRRDVEKHIEVLDMDTLVKSSPKTLDWLNKIKTIVEGRIKSLRYEPKKYWAIFKSKGTNRDVCQLNPQVNQIRLLTKLHPSDDYELEPSPATGEWFETYPSLFVVESEQDIDKAIELIISSWIRD